MIAHVLRRLLAAAVVLVIAVTVAFALVIALPADPARTLVGPHADPATLARARAHYCLDRGLAQRYACFVGGIARGDLGTSLRSRRPVAALIAERAAATAELALVAFALQLAITVPLAAWMARRRRRVATELTDLTMTLGQSVPAFVLGPMLAFLLGYRLGWLPIAGRGVGVADHLRHLVLPAVTLALPGVAIGARVLRDELARALASDHVRAARARGASERRALWRHALPTAARPWIALVGLDLGALVSGAVVVETVFAWPGLGREAMLAVGDLDLPVILGVALVGTAAVTLANALADALLWWLDPRTREPPGR